MNYDGRASWVSWPPTNSEHCSNLQRRMLQMRMWLVWFVAVLHALPLEAGSAPWRPDLPHLFSIAIDLAPADAESLRRHPREPVPARVVIDGDSFPRTAIHIKGSQGSLRPLDDKPALTLSFNQFDRETRFRGLRKLHLNNSVQDPTYLCEDLAAELFRRAGVPAPRVAWASVALNGRKLGLYVVKEGVAKEFLTEHFGSADGNLYDGGLHHDVDEPLEISSGEKHSGRQDLEALAAACREPDPTRRWQRLETVLDVDRFIAFMATEVITDHIDGYCRMQNNYRVYFEPVKSRAVFLPHGMDRMFGNPGETIQLPTRAMVARAIGDTPEGAARYRKRMTALATTVFDPAWMTNRINTAVRRLEPTEPLVAREAIGLRERLITRSVFLRSAVTATNWNLSPNAPK